MYYDFRALIKQFKVQFSKQAALRGTTLFLNETTTNPRKIAKSVFRGKQNEASFFASRTNVSTRDEIKQKNEDRTRPITATSARPSRSINFSPSPPCFHPPSWGDDKWIIYKDMTLLTLFARTQSFSYEYIIKSAKKIRKKRFFM